MGDGPVATHRHRHLGLVDRGVFRAGRHRFLRRFRDAEDRLVEPVPRVLTDTLVHHGIAVDEAHDVTNVAYELVMGQQATSITPGTDPRNEKWRRVASLATGLLRRFPGEMMEKFPYTWKVSGWCRIGRSRDFQVDGDQPLKYSRTPRGVPHREDAQAST